MNKEVLEETISNTNEIEETKDKKVENKRKEMYEDIDNILDEVYSLLKKAEGIADEYGLYFRFDFGCYGSGSWYSGKGKGDFEIDDDFFDLGWLSSSHSCE